MFNINLPKQKGLLSQSSTWFCCRTKPQIVAALKKTSETSRTYGIGHDMDDPKWTDHIAVSKPRPSLQYLHSAKLVAPGLQHRLQPQAWEVIFYQICPSTALVHVSEGFSWTYKEYTVRTVFHCHFERFGRATVYQVQVDEQTSKTLDWRPLHSGRNSLFRFSSETHTHRKNTIEHAQIPRRIRLWTILFLLAESYFYHLGLCNLLAFSLHNQSFWNSKKHT